MMPTNGDRVTTRELYQELRFLEERQSKEREQMEARLVAVITNGNNNVLDQVRCNRQDIDELQDDVIALRIADRKWGGISAIAAAAISAVGVAIGISKQ